MASSVKTYSSFAQSGGSRKCGGGGRLCEKRMESCKTIIFTIKGVNITKLLLPLCNIVDSYEE